MRLGKEKEAMLEDYPKKITLPDGASLTLRPMTSDDQYALYSFFVSLAGEDRQFLRNDVADRKLIEKWARNLNYDRVLPILAENDGRIVANATLHYQTFGWGRHVAEVRVTIAPADFCFVPNEFSITTKDKSTALIRSPRIVDIFGHPQDTVFVGCPSNSLLQERHLILKFSIGHYKIIIFQ